MKIIRSASFIVLCLGCLLASPGSGRTAAYSRVPLLAGPIAVRDGLDTEVALPRPVSRQYELAELEVVFPAGTVVKYTYRGGGIYLSRGTANLVITFVGADGKKYDTDPKIGPFYTNGVLPKFKTLPPLNVPLKKMLVSGTNIQQIDQIFWIDGKKRLSNGRTGENPAYCGKGPCHWREAADYCSANGGRLPTVSELKALYKAECEGKSLDACRNWYWSSEEYAPYPNNAWYVTFYYGQSVTSAKTTTAYVRCLADDGR